MGIGTAAAVVGAVVQVEAGIGWGGEWIRGRTGQGFATPWLLIGTHSLELGAIPPRPSTNPPLTRPNQG